MHKLVKVYPLLTLPTFSLLYLVHSVQCSLFDRTKAGNNNSTVPIFSVDGVEIQLPDRVINSEKTNEIVVHGILLWASMGLLMPVGILVMRMSSTRNCQHQSDRVIFHLHAILQALSVLLVTIGAVLSIRNFENAFDNIHQRIGLALYASIYLQILIGFRRPKRGTKGRSAWYFVHWIIGTTISMVGILNIYTGLQAYRKRTSKSTSLWSIIFTAQVSFMAIFYLFQDKWEYIQRQGVVPSAGAPVVSAAADQLEYNQKDIVNEPSMKSNALGTYFSRRNALDKLFQLT